MLRKKSDQTQQGLTRCVGQRHCSCTMWSKLGATFTELFVNMQSQSVDTVSKITQQLHHTVHDNNNYNNLIMDQHRYICQIK